MTKTTCCANEAKMIAKRKARRKEPADEEVVVCVPFSLGISNEADEGKIFVILVVKLLSMCLSLFLSEM